MDIKNDEALTDANYNYITELEQWASGCINFIMANFERYNYDEKINYLDIVHDLEQCLINCQLFKLEFDKLSKQNNRRDIYRVIEGDTIITVANKFYKDPTKWKQIYEANGLTDFDLSDVETLIIPELTEVDDG